jgi:hypothetical protein
MTKAEVSYLMKAGFTLGEIIELDQERGNAEPVKQPEAAPAEAPAATPEPEAPAPVSPENAAPSPQEDALAKQVEKLTATVEKLQAAALANLSQPGGRKESMEDIVAAM